MTRFLFGDLAPGEKRDAEEESHLLSLFNWYLSVGGRGSGTHFHRHGNTCGFGGGELFSFYSSLEPRRKCVAAHLRG